MSKAPYTIKRCTDNHNIWIIRIKKHVGFGKYYTVSYWSTLTAISKLLPGLRNCNTAKERFNYAQEWANWCDLRGHKCDKV